MPPDPVVWLEGTLRPATDARIMPHDRGFTLSDGVYETLRAESGRILHADRHLARLHDGAALLGIPIRHSDAELVEAMTQVLAASDLCAAAIRITLTRGPALRGIMPPRNPTPTLVIAATPLPIPAPARLVIATKTRRNEFSPLSRIKSLSMLDSIIARMEAERAGADDAILLNTQGRVAEATAANVFARIGGQWITPPLEDGALPGIARGLALEQGRVREAPIAPEALLAADALRLVNALVEREAFL